MIGRFVLEALAGRSCQTGDVTLVVDCRTHPRWSEGHESRIVPRLKLREMLVGLLAAGTHKLPGPAM